MKTHSIRIALAAAATLCVAGLVLAEQTLTDYGRIQGRTFHEDLYADPGCVDCHGNAEPSGFPADDVCLDCHDLAELVQATARPEGEEGQNPHDNLHYGQDVPCMECHGEHAVSKPLCQGCHSFSYPDYKP